MPVPTIYSEAQLWRYLQFLLGETADALGWDATSPAYEEITIEALLMLGFSTMPDATDVRSLRVAARVALWRFVLQSSAGAIDSSLDGQSVKRSQIQLQAANALKEAEAEAAMLGINTGSPGNAVLGRMTTDWAEPALINGWF